MWFRGARALFAGLLLAVLLVSLPGLSTGMSQRGLQRSTSVTDIGTGRHRDRHRGHRRRSLSLPHNVPRLGPLGDDRHVGGIGGVGGVGGVGNDDLDVMVLRHGKSTGNTGYFWMAADGALTAKGKRQARDAARSLDDTTRNEVCGGVPGEAQDIQNVAYVTSPLRRAFGTFLIFYVTACTPPPGQQNRALILPENFQISKAVREKRKSKSEDVGSGFRDSVSYISTLVESLLRGRDKQALRADLIKLVKDAYNQEIRDPRRGWLQTVVQSNEGRWLTQLRQIDDVVLTNLVQRHEHLKRVLIVAHSGVGRSRWACAFKFDQHELHRRFYTLYLYKHKAQVENKFPQETALKWGMHEAKVLGNAGFIKLKYDKNTMVSRLDEHATMHYANLEQKKNQAAPFLGSSKFVMDDKYVKECRTAGIIPPHSVFNKVDGIERLSRPGVHLLSKQTGKFLQATFANGDTTKHTVSTLSWAKDFGGKKLHFIELSDAWSVKMKNQREVEVLQGGRLAYTFQFMADNNNAHDFVALFQRYKLRNFAALVGQMMQANL